MSYLRDQHWATSDPFLRGTQAAQLCTLMSMTHGQMWPWMEGGAMLLRRTLYPTFGSWEYCGISTPAEGTIRQYDGFVHAPSQAYQYTAVRLLGNGFVSTMARPIRLDFDDEGALILPLLPAPPRDLAVTTLSGGRFRVTWSYDALGQGGYPHDFQVFEGEDAGSIDYDTPLVDSITGLNHVRYLAGRSHFAFTTAAFAHGSDHVLAVRGRNSEAVAEQNTQHGGVVIARSTAPSGADAPREGIVSAASGRPGS